MATFLEMLVWTIHHIDIFFYLKSHKMDQERFHDGNKDNVPHPTDTTFFFV